MRRPATSSSVSLRRDIVTARWTITHFRGRCLIIKSGIAHGGRDFARTNFALSLAPFINVASVSSSSTGRFRYSLASSIDCFTTATILNRHVDQIRKLRVRNGNNLQSDLRNSTEHPRACSPRCRNNVDAVVKVLRKPTMTTVRKL